MVTNKIMTIPYGEKIVIGKEKPKYADYNRSPEFHISVIQMFASIHEQASGKNDTVHGYFLLRLGIKSSKYTCTDYACSEGGMCTHAVLDLS